MNSPAIDILEFPSNLGLRKTDYAAEPGVKQMPAWLRKFGFHDEINPQQVLRLEPPSYSMNLDEAAGVRNANNIASYAMEQSNLLLQQLNAGNFQLIIGGDCSILIGNAMAFRQKGEFGLFFLDGHTDFILPEQSQTGGAAGMDLALVTGHGHEKLTNIKQLQPYFKEENVFCVGNREYDEDYVQPILHSKVKYFDLKSLRANGLANTANAFLNLVDEKKLDGFFIHFDLDVLDDNIMPAVDSRQPGGLSYDELSSLLTPLLSSSKAFGIELTILDPDLDRDGQYTKEFVRQFTKMIKTT